MDEKKAGSPCPLCSEPLIDGGLQWLCARCGHSEEQPRAMAAYRRNRLKSVLIGVPVAILMLGGLAASIHFGSRGDEVIEDGVNIFALLQQHDEHFSAAASAVIVYGFGVGAPILLVLFALIASGRWRAKAAQEERSRKPGSKLEAGPVTVFGRVELAAGEQRAVRVEVDQLRTTMSQSENLWSEKRRRIEVHPFYLRRDSGERVRVEPTPSLHYMDEMDGVTRVEENHRIRFAELRPGEAVFVFGELVRGQDPEADAGYRGGGHALVLRPLPHERMLVSSNRPGCDFRRRARARVFCAGFTLCVALAINLLLAPYHARRIAATNEKGTVSSLSKSRHRRGTDYHVHVKVKGTEISDLLSRGRWNLLKLGVIVPVRFVERWPWTSAVGWDATVSIVHGIFVGIALFFSVLCYVSQARRARSWHEGRALVEEWKMWATNDLGRDGRMHELWCTEITWEEAGDEPTIPPEERCRTDRLCLGQARARVPGQGTGRREHQCPGMG